MKKLVKILGILTVGFLLGGMIIACHHDTNGFAGYSPDTKADSIDLSKANPAGGGSVPEAFKTLAKEGSSGYPEIVSELEITGLSSDDPNNWSSSDWQNVYTAFKNLLATDFASRLPAGVSSNPDNWSSSDWVKLSDMLKEEY
jgi:hypothetical protein